MDRMVRPARLSWGVWSATNLHKPQPGIAANVFCVFNRCPLATLSSILIWITSTIKDCASVYAPIPPRKINECWTRNLDSVITQIVNNCTGIGFWVVNALALVSTLRLPLLANLGALVPRITVGVQTRNDGKTVGPPPIRKILASTHYTCCTGWWFLSLCFLNREYIK